MIEYFVTRKRWRLIVEKRLNRQKIHLAKHWSKWFTQKIVIEKEMVRNDKDNDIRLLTEEIQTTKKELRDYKKEVLNYDLNVEKLKNELSEKIIALDSQLNKWNSFIKGMTTNVGRTEMLNREGEKLLNKDVS